jgi:uncharacterized protein DUF1592/uncharacterized protein DUF1588/uncharacterized protein DUF1595/uncharacterized protein DUF1587/uncharacterized protein DUF1585
MGDGNSGAPTGTGAGSTGTGTGNTGTGGGTSTGTGGQPPAACQGVVKPGRAPIRRLTRFEYNNAVTDLFGDLTAPASSLPPETIGRVGNVFGNDADLQSVSDTLALQWDSVAEGVATRATTTPAGLAKLPSCMSNAAPDDTCARTVIDSVASRAFHRAIAPTEVDAFLALSKAARGTSTFASGIAAVIEAVLQEPEFLYRVELGTPATDQPTLRRPTGDELAARLSFLFWGTIPDAALRTAAVNGDLATPQGVMTQAKRLVEAPQARSVVRFFFDNLLPISGLTNLARDPTLFPAYAMIGSSLREETQQFLDHQIFDPGSAGTWASALTAPYTYVNGPLATFYGIPGVTGNSFQRVQLPDTTKRLGLLTQSGILTGTITTNKSNPVLRGSFIANKMLCRSISLPTDPAILAQVKLPSDVSGATARERFSAHSAQAVCHTCHQQLDPFGFAFENYDPIGQWRDTEGGETIDAKVTLPGTTTTVNGPIDLVKNLATMPDAQTCFAQHWLEFGYGKTLDSGDECTQAAINSAFLKTGGNVKQLLLDLTQTDAFLYLPAKD